MSSENGGKFSHALVLGAGMEPVLLNHVDHVGGVATGLNAIGHAIIEARFAGLRSFVVQGVGLVWQWRTDTPEGVYFALLCDRAKRGKTLPSVEKVMEVLLPLRNVSGGGAK